MTNNCVGGLLLGFLKKRSVSATPQITFPWVINELSILIKQLVKAGQKPCYLLPRPLLSHDTPHKTGQPPLPRKHYENVIRRVLSMFPLYKVTKSAF